MHFRWKIRRRLELLGALRIMGETTRREAAKQLREATKQRREAAKQRREATKQRREATKQRREATKQRSNEATKQRSNVGKQRSNVVVVFFRKPCVIISTHFQVNTMFVSIFAEIEMLYMLSFLN